MIHLACILESVIADEDFMQETDSIELVRRTVDSVQALKRFASRD